MKRFCTKVTRLLAVLSVATATRAIAHEGHGQPGTATHDLQHQFWLFVALAVIGAMLLYWQRRRE